ncbi:MAG: hypothetical protein PUK76_13495 [Treponema sp.]|nr:hypothetical protein [Treponema sp.]
MDENSMNENQVADAAADLKNEIRKTNRKLSWLMFIVLLMTILCGYLCFEVYRSTNSTGVMDSSHRILIVSMESNLSDSERSDRTQVRNALDSGGMIRIRLGNDDIEYSMGTSFKAYGADNADGEFWTVGGLLNYIASRGWTLVQAPSSGPTDEFYFIK